MVRSKKHKKDEQISLRGAENFIEWINAVIDKATYRRLTSTVNSAVRESALWSREGYPKGVANISLNVARNTPLTLLRSMNTSTNTEYKSFI